MCPSAVINRHPSGPESRVSDRRSQISGADQIFFSSRANKLARCRAADRLTSLVR
jgi:hypothetical protein